MRVFIGSDGQSRRPGEVVPTTALHTAHRDFYTSPFHRYEHTLSKRFSYPVGAMSRAEWIDYCVTSGKVRIDTDQDGNTGYFEGDRWLFSATKAEQAYYKFLQERLG
jgi:hypothetical protein